MALDTLLKAKIRTIPDYPAPGILFRDVTTLIADAEGFAAAIDGLVAPFKEWPVDLVVGIEARGFIFGAAVAAALGRGFVPVRKKGKLPGDTIAHHYDLEYGTDTVEIHNDSIKPGQQVLLIDDLLATGGTAEAAITLVERLKGRLVGCAFVVDLPDLGGRKRLEDEGHQVRTLCSFAGA